MADLDKTNSTELYLRLYEEERAHARFHEEHINSTTNLVALAVSGIVTFSFSDLGFDIKDIFASMAVVLLGLYGIVVTHKKAERRKLHFSRGYEFLKQIKLPTGAEDIEKIAKRGDAALEKERPKLYNMRIRTLWSYFHKAIVSFGILMLLVSLASIVQKNLF
ncbi:MAG: hypothetical protein WBA91_07040 [Paracoccaceae bacterium]